MGTSYVEYRGQGFWSWYGYLEHLMDALAAAAENAGAESWLAEAADYWRYCSGYVDCFATPEFDRFLTTDERRDTVLSLVASIVRQEGITPELRDTCALLTKLLKGDLQTDAASPLTYLVSGEFPYHWRRDPWDMWRGDRPSPSPQTADDRPVPSGGRWYLAEVLYARPPRAGKSVCQQETCHVCLHGLSVAEAYRTAFAWGQAHATEAPGEVRLLAVSRLATIGEYETNLLTPEQLAELARVRKQLWPNGAGERRA